MNLQRRSFLKNLIGGTLGLFAAKKVLPEIQAKDYHKTYIDRSLKANPITDYYGSGRIICYSGIMPDDHYKNYNVSGYFGLNNNLHLKFNEK